MCFELLPYKYSKVLTSNRFIQAYLCLSTTVNVRRSHYRTTKVRCLVQVWLSLVFKTPIPDARVPVSLAIRQQGFPGVIRLPYTYKFVHCSSFQIGFDPPARLELASLTARASGQDVINSGCRFAGRSKVVIPTCHPGSRRELTFKLRRVKTYLRTSSDPKRGQGEKEVKKVGPSSCWLFFKISVAAWTSSALNGP